MTAKLRNLLANHILMIVLLACIMLIPFGVAELLGGRLRTGDSIGVIIGTGSEMLVQAFWALSTYLLLQERWTLPVKLYAVFAAIFFVLFFTAFPLTILLDGIPEPSPDVSALAIAAYATLYLLLLCQIGERLGKTVSGTVGYTLLAFYWPLCLFVFRDRLKNGFEQAAIARSRPI
tara:strand:- start:919 stop:1446 length:528 start_codon:yes stop_codon:yes gene_type:complete